MAKIHKAYFCQSCGYESAKWLGRCPSCGEWNTLVEELVTKDSGDGQLSFLPQGNAKPVPVDSISIAPEPRMGLGSGEVDRILGGGLVPGSMVLIGGEPGIGKSTLALQLALKNPLMKTLYVSGEESAQQIKLRADRLGGSGKGCYILSETLLENILAHAQELKPNLVVIDSIQTLASKRIESSPGSVSQIRDCAAMLLKYAKETGTPIFVIGHITKDGVIAGPKVLEHIVDVVMQFEGDGQHIYRILRSTKNRFGATSELGIFEMTGAGLREVSNPSEMLITHHHEPLSGVAIAASVDGVRPFLIEIQSLVSTAVYGTPQRSTTGFDIRRLNMLLAVLEKRAGFRLATKDVFLNIAGGIRVSDPAIDLAVAVAVLSSNLDLPIPAGCCFAAEVGLSGEVRPVARIDQRISEAEKMGFKKIFASAYNRKGLKASGGIEVVFSGKIEELLQKLFGAGKSG
ncbi:MAG: DNA repair protein RadA [Prevotellaceae bacterium]|jgi:DNA repair protein RadA/Sms|nr:DNA repair protein RadA [Prevotellaceae bacterium]